MGGHARLRHAAGDERPLAVSHFEQPLAAQPFVHAEHGVLIHGQLAGQFADGGEPVAWLDASGGAERRDLVGNLPGDRDGRAFFDSQKHAEIQWEIATDYSSVTVVRSGCQENFF